MQFQVTKKGQHRFFNSLIPENECIFRPAGRSLRGLDTSPFTNVVLMNDPKILQSLSVIYY